MPVCDLRVRAIVTGLLLTKLLCFDANQSAGAHDSLRIARPVFKLNMAKGLIDAEPYREPIAEASDVPGIYKGFLIWRQKYCHLAICHTDLCNGSCIAYGDGCIVCAQAPVIPAALAGLGGSCASGCAPSYVKQTKAKTASSCCASGECP